MTMTLIETKTLGTAAAAIEFTSIPQDGTDLLLVVSNRSTQASVAQTNTLSINGSTANFSSRYLTTGGNPFSTTGTNGIGITSGNSATANTFGNISYYFPNYTSSSNKSISTDSVSENNGDSTTTYLGIYASLWSNTAAITSIGVGLDAGNHSVGSMFSLYKITKGSSGGVVVS